MLFVSLLKNKKHFCIEKFKIHKQIAPLQWPLKIKKILKKTKIEKIKSNNYSIRLLNLNRYYIYRPLLFDLVILFNNTWINYMHVLLNQLISVSLCYYNSTDS
jgi:hypothetical protein